MTFYQSLTKKRLTFLTILALSLVIFAFFDLTVGYYDLNFRQFLPWIHDELGTLDTMILYKLRLPKTLTCTAVGSCLGVSGYCIQNILKNPIANPFTLGISSAASCGAALSILTGFPFLLPYLNVQVSAILFSLLCTYLMLFGLIKRQMDARLMILFGVTLNFFFLACQSLLQYAANEKQAQQIIQWTFGSLEKSSWTSVVVIFSTFVLFFLLLSTKAWDLNLLALSDDRAQAMGLNINRSRRFFFLCSSILTSVAISYVGTIGFIGLLAPHLARFLLGNDSRFCLLGSSLSGALILLFASVLSKTILPGGLLPIGIITNILGVPFMALIVFGRKIS